MKLEEGSWNPGWLWKDSSRDSEGGGEGGGGGGGGGGGEKE